MRQALAFTHSFFYFWPRVWNTVSPWKAPCVSDCSVLSVPLLKILKTVVFFLACYYFFFIDALVNRMGPILLQDKSQLHVAQSTLQKLNELGYQVLPLLPYSPDFSPNNNSLQAKCSHNQEEAGKAFKVFAESQSVDFYATGTSKLISHWQKCVDCNHSYFD